MQKIWAILICLLLLLTGCKKAASEAPSSPDGQTASAAATVAFSEDETKLLSETYQATLENDDWDHLNSVADSLLKNYGPETPQWQSLMGLKFSVLLFGDKIEEAKEVEKLVKQHQPNGPLAASISQANPYDASNITLTKASIYIMGGQQEKAEALLQDILKKEDLTPEARQVALSLQARSLIAQGKAEEGLEKLREAVEADPQSEIGELLQKQVDQIQTSLRSPEEATLNSTLEDAAAKAKEELEEEEAAEAAAQEAKALQEKKE